MSRSRPNAIALTPNARRLVHGGRRAAARRRGGIYAIVLMTSAIVTVIGVSGLVAVRIQHNSIEGAHRAIEARAHARSAIEKAMLRLSTDADWRSTYTHDQWTDGIPMDRGVLRFKLVDATGSDLAANPTGAVWLYGQASHGLTERHTRTLLQPRFKLPGANLLRNSGMANGTRHWWTHSDISRLRYTEHVARRGEGSLYFAPRDQPGAGVNQHVTDRIESGTTYRLEAWVYMDRKDDFLIQLYIRDSINGEQWFGHVTRYDEEYTWQRVRAVVTPTWSGTLEEAFIQVRVRHRVRDPFFVDQVLLMPERYFHEMVPVHGTWEQVVY